METPIQKLCEPVVNGNSFYIKRDDLLPFSLGGNKVRIADEFFADMKRCGCDSMLMYGNSRSNLCRVLANLCFRNQIPCYMVCSHEDFEEEAAISPTSNSKLMEWMAVTVVNCRKTEIAAAVSRTLAMMKQKGLHPYYIYGDQYGSGNESVPVPAYLKAYQEICAWEEKNLLHFDFLFFASGTGATQSGLILGHLLAKDHRNIVGISISRDRERGIRLIRTAVDSYLERKNLSLPYDPEAEIQLADEYRLGGYGHYNQEVLDCIRQVFLLDGIPLDPTYTGKAYLGMKKYVKDHKITNGNILFLHTGGTPLFYDTLNI